MNVYYLEDAVHPANENQILTNQGLDPAVFMVITHPINGNLYHLQRNSQGFQPDNDRTIFWGMRSASVDRWRTILVHETNHARNAVPTNIVSRYRSEFRAYWVAEFAGVADLDDRPGRSAPTSFATTRSSAPSTIRSRPPKPPSTASRARTATSTITDGGPRLVTSPASSGRSVDREPRDCRRSRRLGRLQQHLRPSTYRAPRGHRDRNS